MKLLRLQRDRDTTLRSGYIIELQSLRGIAATAVLFGHVVGYYTIPEWLISLGQLSNGRSAVVVFFVLSGYVLTRSLRSSPFDPQAIARFYLQRCFRIYPAIWAASLLGLLYLVTLHWAVPVHNVGPNFTHNFRADRYDFLHIAASFAGLQAFLLPQLWSIFIEIMASIALPGIAYIALRRPAWMPFLLAIGIGVSFSIPHSPYETCLYFMDFIVGAALAMHRLPLILPAWLIPVCLVILSITLWLPFPYYSPTIHLIETAFSALIVAVLISRPVSWLRSRFLVFIGDISYSMYLLHYVVLSVAAKIFAVVGLDYSGVAMTMLLACVTFGVTVPLSWLSYTYIERPAMRVGRTFLERDRTRLIRSDGMDQAIKQKVRS